MLINNICVYVCLYFIYCKAYVMCIIEKIYKKFT